MAMKLFSTRKVRKQFIYIIVILVLLLLTADLNGRISDLLKANTERDAVRAQVYSLWVTQQVLSTQAAYAQSEHAVEGWARQDGRLVKPGDVPIVPLPVNKVTQAPLLPTPMPTPTSVENWQIWRSMIFGDS